MKAVTAILPTRPAAEGITAELESTCIFRNQVTMLCPGSKIASLPVSPTAPPGNGKVIDRVVNAALGGLGVGTAVATAAIPGVGPVVALGVLGLSLLALGRAVVGAADGALQNNTTHGLPEDELFFYEDALRKGRSVVVVMAEDEDSAEAIRAFFEAEGAESTDATRNHWWIGSKALEKATTATCHERVERCHAA